MSSDAEAVQALVESAGPNSRHVILHYLYLPTQQNAQTVAGALEQRGFRTQHLMSADDVNWLVLARHDVTLTLELVTSTRQIMEELVAPFTGEYDGWEVEIEAKGDTH